MAAKDKQETLDRVVKDFEECRKSHENRCDKYTKRHRAYQGILERKSEANSWHSKLHPPVILQIIETMVANLVDPSPTMRLRARPKGSDRPEELVKAAQTLEKVVRYQLDVDRFAEKQRPFILQGLITGLTVGKTYWQYEVGKSKSLGYEYAHNGFGGAIPVLSSYESEEVLLDDPTFEVVDVYDFLWHEAATSLDNAKYVIHRVWMTYEELKRLEENGYYGEKAGGQPVKLLKESRFLAGELADRPQTAVGEDKGKDQIEVLEYWSTSLNKCCTVANRKVLLREGELPFWHGQYPFVTASTMPQMFRIDGLSEVEVVAHLQEMLWTLMNQRIDNVRLLNNMVTVIQEGIDTEGWDVEPGAQWFTPGDPRTSVMPLPTDKSVAQVSLEAESLIRGDLQNVSGGMPFMSGTESQSIDQNTATGVSIVTSLAQKRLAAKKQHFTWAWKRVAEQFVALDQQFITDEKWVEIAGPDGKPDFLHVDPAGIQGRFDVVAEIQNESLMRQERRAEAQAKLQVAGELSAYFAAVQKPLNLKAFMDDYLDAFDVQDKDRYYTAEQSQVPPAAPAPGPPGGAGGEPSPGGVTSPTATSPMAPSNANSMSPVAALQQMAAMKGGVVNG